MITIKQLYDLFTQHPVVATDSRKLKGGELFFALKGDQFDGNAYAAIALEKGAAYALIDNPAFYENNGRYILVEDTLQSLQLLAKYHRNQFDIPLLAITGTNGKTTTKELINAVLSQQYHTHSTRGNFNNHIGVPLSLLAMPLETEIAVIEMGANHIGEIAQLCAIADPTHGIITNIGKAHLEGFGSLEGVKQAKSELYTYLAQHNGLAFLNKDEAYLEKLSKNVKKIYYLRSNHPDPEIDHYEIKLIEYQPFVKVAFLSWEEGLVEASSQLIGEYNFDNIMTAVAVGKYFKVPADKIRNAIESYLPQNNRSQILTRGSNVFILDAYNANPTSMRSAVKTFSEMKAKNKMVILGEMLELGDSSQKEHDEIIQYAKRSKLDNLIVVGESFLQAANHYKLRYFNNVEELKDWFSHKRFTNTHFLIKGSRKIHLEELLGMSMN